MVRTHRATGYMASNQYGSQGPSSKIGRLRRYGGGSRYAKGSIVELESRGCNFTVADKSNIVLVSKRRVHEGPTYQHPDSCMSTTVTHDPQHRPHHSNGSRGPDDIVVTRLLEQSVAHGICYDPRAMHDFLCKTEPPGPAPPSAKVARACTTTHSMEQQKSGRYGNTVMFSRGAAPTLSGASSLLCWVNLRYKNHMKLESPTVILDRPESDNSSSRLT